MSVLWLSSLSGSLEEVDEAAAAIPADAGALVELSDCELELDLVVVACVLDGVDVKVGLLKAEVGLPLLRNALEGDDDAEVEVAVNVECAREALDDLEVWLALG